MDEPREKLKVEEKCNKELSSKCNGDPIISPPIYFLVREQAKLMVTIKEIQRRLKLLEESQNNVTSVVQDIQFQINFKDCNNRATSLPTLMLSGDLNSNVKSGKKELPNSFTAMLSDQLLDEKCFKEEIQIKDNSYEKNNILEELTNLRENGILSQSLHKKNDDKLILDCDKQDSGLESDHGQGVNLQTDSKNILPDSFNKNKKDQDELLVLLDIIKERGISLRQEVDDLKELTRSDIDLNSLPVDVEVEKEMERLHTEKESLQQLIEEVEDEKLSMKNKLVFLEMASQELKEENKKLIDNLELALSEKQQLEMKIHSLHMQFVKGTSTPKADSWPPLRFKNSERPKKLDKESSHLKISHILNETNMLELQRKLLLYLMENEVLYAKLWHAEQSLTSRTSEWKKKEVNLHSRIRHLAAAKDELQIKLGENNLELTAAQAKVQMLEKVLGAVTQDSRDIFDMISTNKSSVKDLYSLPLVLRDGTGKKCDHLCREIKPFSDQSTYVDITLIQSDKCQELNTDRKNYTLQYTVASTMEGKEPRSSTPFPTENGWGSGTTNSTLITFNDINAEMSLSKMSDATELSVTESDFTPIMSDQQLSRTVTHTENNLKSSLSELSDVNASSSIWEDNIKINSSVMQNGHLISSINGSANSSIVNTSLCQTDDQFQSNEKINPKEGKQSLGINVGYDFGMHLKNSADIRQQIQDILDHITGITAADEALV